MIPSNFPQIFSIILFFFCGLPLPFSAAAQEGIFDSRTGRELTEAEIEAVLPESFDLFGTHEPLELEIVSDFKQLIKNKANTEYQPAQLIYRPDANTIIRRDIRIQARGNSRREICYFPPLKLNFKKTEFRVKDLQELDKMKMVSYCKKGKVYEAYHLKEYLCYRILNMLTPNSFRVRLIRMRYVDTGRKKTKPFDSYAFLIEPVDQVGKRLQAQELEEVKIIDKYTDPAHMDLIAVFQFMIANYDWSVPELHNIKLFRFEDPNVLPIAVPYDFDYCGLVNADYAVPPEQLEIESVTDRLFRGYCRSREEYKQTFAVFRKKKEAIYSLIQDYPYLEDAYQKEMTRFLDAFYRIIDNDNEVGYYFIENCRKN